MESDSQNSKTEQQYIQEATTNADTLGMEDFSIVNPLELIYKFLFEPNSDYREIGKQWSLTYLTQADMNEILVLAKNIRNYDQEKFYETIQERKLSSFEKVFIEVDGQKVEQIKPKYTITLKFKSRFHEMIEKDLGRIQAICAAAGGRSGALIRAFRTTNLEKNETVEDKTAPKSPWFKRSQGEK